MKYKIKVTRNKTKVVFNLSKLIMNQEDDVRGLGNHIVLILEAKYYII